MRVDVTNFFCIAKKVTYRGAKLMAMNKSLTFFFV